MNTYTIAWEKGTINDNIIKLLNKLKIDYEFIYQSMYISVNGQSKKLVYANDKNTITVTI